MDPFLEESERTEPELALTVLGGETVRTVDNNDEVEELHNSLKEVVQDQDVNPKFQCLMMDPSFSMVTVQSEASSIVWEATDSRCSTPGVAASEGCAAGAPATPGQVIFILDKDKSRRKVSSSQSKPEEKQRKPKTTVTENALGGPDRLAMTEVSVPNIRPESADEDPESKDQQLFSIVSDGLEILNIMVPSKLSTVDEEESTAMPDNLFYLEVSPMIRSKQVCQEMEEPYFELSTSGEPELWKDESQPQNEKALCPRKLDTLRSIQSSDGKHAKDGAAGMDYFEKFTLMDECSPGDIPSHAEEQAPSKHTKAPEASVKQQQQKQTVLTSEGQDHFAAAVSDSEIDSERLDEVFYGSSTLDAADSAEEEDNKPVDTEQPKTPLKASGSALFGSEEMTLEPIFLSPGPPKIIDPILLEEPPAMSFFYADLYAAAVGSRKKEDEAWEEVGSVTSDISLHRRFSDAEEVSGYFEKFILKDETPVIKGGTVADTRGPAGLGTQVQHPFEIGALERVQEPAEEEAAEEDGSTAEKPTSDVIESQSTPDVPVRATPGPVVTENKQLDGTAVPHKPLLQTQEPNSATCTSITVSWRVQEGNIVECFHVYRKEKSQGGTCDECKVTVKDSSCTIEDLAPDKSYDVWVTAFNNAGSSPPSDKLTFLTAPSVPVISTKKCTVLWDSATIRWSTTCPKAVETYTLEYCRQTTSEGEGLRSISGIKHCEQNVSLHPNETYLFYVKAVNAAGTSEQSEGVLISTRGTKFYLLKDTADQALEVSEDGSTVTYSQKNFTKRATINKCPGVRGELLPPRGHYYWETEVGTSKAYRIGVAYQSTPRDAPVGETSTSWCLRCYSTFTSVQYELLHNNAKTSVRTPETATRIGVLLDYSAGRLAFFNSQNGQPMGSLKHAFSQSCQIILALEKPGTLALQPAVEAPDFTKQA